MNLDSAQLELVRVENRLAAQKQVYVRIMASADAAGVSMERRKTHPSYQQLTTTIAQLFQQRNFLGDMRARCLITIQEGMNFYTRYAEQGVLHAGRRDFTDHVNRLRGNPMVTAQAIDASNYNPGGPRSIPTTDQMQTPYFPQVPVVDDTLLLAQMSYGVVQTTGNIHAAVEATSERPAAVGNLTQPTTHLAGKRGRQAKRMIDDESGVEQQNKRGGTSMSPKKARAQKDTSSVRRSTRVRNKKISYAESEGSSIHSREQSPAKSDISVFSPPKSDQSGSPAKSDRMHRRALKDTRDEVDQLNNNRMGRGGSSLGNMIDDWKKRSSRFGGEGRLGHGALSDGNRTTSNTLEQQRVDYNDTIPPPSRQGSSTIMPQGPSLGPPLFGRVGPDFWPAQQSSQHGVQVRPPTRRGPPGLNPFGSNMGPPPSVPNSLTPTVSSTQIHPAARNAQANYLLNSAQTASPVPTPQNLFGHYAGRSMSGGTLNRPVHFQNHAPNLQPAQAPPNRQWLINTPAFLMQAGCNPVSQTPQVTADSLNRSELRSDSALGMTPNETFTFPSHLPVATSYEGRRRSFGPATELTPPAAGDYNKTITEPKKRALPASSPGASRNKHMRLSLPGEDTTPNIYDQPLPFDQTVAVSSPSKMPSQPIGGEHIEGDPQSPSSSYNAAATPAPILTPTARMYEPSRQAEGTEERYDEEAVDSDELPGEAQYTADGVAMPSSEIDWGDLLQDDWIE
ncbi:hypothetical protein LTR37_008645 [Vermiconidia calcicola]|uniref:Uncharacterized protein n=1 Tax=Vermiconidia calcicola TaxID=1690605 RepID=A0ACC3NBL0_9PEZI|nr:hypothetical protein LTR37_008645 [Vermiconidia calcicola]